jgi:protein-S-isoprenylcysteine O-methyltransferase Ste14
MTMYHWIIFLSWIAFFSYWLISAKGSKKVIQRGPHRERYGSVAILVVITLVFLYFFPDFHIFPRTVAFQQAGAILCAVGVAFAIWARIHLGRNWNKEPSIQEEHELVTSGPYRLVRHPMYTGMLLAFIGTSFVAGLIWLVVFIFLSYKFIRRIPVEEAFMMQLFPQTYPEYKKRTKALIPFIW